MNHIRRINQILQIHVPELVTPLELVQENPWPMHPKKSKKSQLEKKNRGILQQRSFSHHPALYRTLANRFTICTFLPADSAAKNLRADRAKFLVSCWNLPLHVPAPPWETLKFFLLTCHFNFVNIFGFFCIESYARFRIQHLVRKRCANPRYSLNTEGKICFFCCSSYNSDWVGMDRCCAFWYGAWHTSSGCPW